MSILCGFLRDENNHLTKSRAAFQNFSSFGLASLIIRYSRKAVDLPLSPAKYGHSQSRSAQAAKEIEGLISESVRLIDLGSDEVATAGKTMCTIVDAVASVTHIMQEIATASGEQSRGITQVSQAISEMDKVTQQNASLVEEASTAAVSLEEQAARLTEAVDVFRLNKHSVSAEPRGAGEPVSFATV